MTNYAAGAALILLAAFSGLAGWAWRDSSARDQVAAAKSATSECTTAAEATAAEVAALKARYSDLIERHEQLRDAASAALAARDEEIAVVRREEAARIHSIRGAAHADASCVALARLPVCAAIADQLWTDPAPGSRDARPDR